jgi:hypothetical protein
MRNRPREETATVPVLAYLTRVEALKVVAVVPRAAAALREAAVINLEGRTTRQRPGENETKRAW